MWDSILSKLEELLLYVPRKIYEWITEQLGQLIASIDAPEWYAYAANVFSGGGDVGYWLSVFNVPQGIAIIFSAYGLRFLIRRIPFIG